MRSIRFAEQCAVARRPTPPCGYATLLADFVAGSAHLVLRGPLGVLLGKASASE